MKKSFLYKNTTLELVLGDITEQQVDVIVNAAKPSLMGGGGVDGAIHQKGGPEILEECREIVAQQGECNVSEAVITSAGNLPAKHVIHTVGPVWKGSNYGENVALERCYTNSLALTQENGASSIAFPAISTGSYGFPLDRAAYIALRAAMLFKDELKGHIDLVRYVVFSEQDFEVFAPIFEEVTMTMSGSLDS